MSTFQSFFCNVFDHFYSHLFFIVLVLHNFDLLSVQENYDDANKEALWMTNEYVNRNAGEAGDQQRESRTFWRHHHRDFNRVPVRRRPVTDPTVPQRDVITDSEGFGIGDS